MKPGRIVGCILSSLSCLAAAAVEVSPGTLVIHSREQAEMLTITDGGNPVPKTSIGTVRFLVDDHEYGHMIEVERMDGGLVVRPTPELEIGTYELQITVGNERVRCNVVANLGDDPDSIENRAGAAGLTADQYRRELGLYKTGRHTLQLDLPEWYYVGRQVRFEIPAPQTARFEWRVNGEVVETGYGPHTFEYTLRRAGGYRFEYLEGDSGGWSVYANADTQAREPEPRVVVLEKDQAVHLLGPAGFNDYIWLVDGEAVSTSPDLTRTFETPGIYRAECIASGGSPTDDVAFQKAIYEIRVR